MHQLPRPSPRSAASASNPATNPERTNNLRERPHERTRSSVDLASYTERAGTGTQPAVEIPRSDMASGSQDRDAAKLNQVIQHFHTKAALTICSSRAHLPQVYTRDGAIKQNRWFNTVLDETDVLQDHLLEWRRPDLAEDRPRALVVEIYLDASHLSHNQALVVVDESGKRCDVAESLAPTVDASQRPSRTAGRYGEIVLERWTVELSDAEDHTAADLDEVLPNVYKKSVVLFRSLFTVARLLPAFKLHRRCGRQQGSLQGLKLKFRIKLGDEVANGRKDNLYTPLCPSEQGGVAERHRFPPVLCRAGPLGISVDYRTNCEFEVADAEALLSSRFLRSDEAAPTIPAGRSLPGARTQPPRAQYGVAAATVGDQRPRVGAYGSLGTFHGTGNRASPITALKQRVCDDEDDHTEDMERINAIRDEEGAAARRQSVNWTSNPPFKAGSLASSPRPAPSPSTSVGRSESMPLRPAAASAPKRVSLNTMPQQSLRMPNETAIASSGSSSPKPAPLHRYSSSFANRTKRYTQQGSKTGESNLSSGRASSSSKEKSSRFDESTPGSSGSGRTDDEDIADFISVIEAAKDLPSLRARPASRDNTVNLSRYTSLRDPNAQLVEEINASICVPSPQQASVTPPSRRLSNVPGLSTSSSPSRTLAHAPHVRSRLSTQSIAEEGSGTSRGSAEGFGTAEIREEGDDDEDEEPFIFSLNTE